MLRGKDWGFGCTVGILEFDVAKPAQRPLAVPHQPHLHQTRTVQLGTVERPLGTAQRPLAVPHQPHLHQNQTLQLGTAERPLTYERERGAHPQLGTAERTLPYDRDCGAHPRDPASAAPSSNPNRSISSVNLPVPPPMVKLYVEAKPAKSDEIDPYDKDRGAPPRSPAAATPSYGKAHSMLIFSSTS